MRGRRMVALLLLAAFLPACTGVYQVDVAQPRAVTLGEHKLRVTLQDGSEFWMLRARLAGDSLVGGVYDRRQLVRTAVPFKQVRTLAESRTNAEGTLLLGVGLAVVLAGVVVAQSLQGCCGWSFSSSWIP